MDWELVPLIAVITLLSTRVIRSIAARQYLTIAEDLRSLDEELKTQRDSLKDFQQIADEYRRNILSNAPSVGTATGPVEGKWSESSRSLGWVTGARTYRTGSAHELPKCIRLSTPGFRADWAKHVYYSVWKSATAEENSTAARWVTVMGQRPSPMDDISTGKSLGRWCTDPSDIAHYKLLHETVRVWDDEVDARRLHSPKTPKVLIH